jgi:hypothetical protein
MTKSTDGGSVRGFALTLTWEFGEVEFPNLTEEEAIRIARTCQPKWKAWKLSSPWGTKFDLDKWSEND